MFILKNAALQYCLIIKLPFKKKKEVQNSPVTRSSYEAELDKMMSHFELLTRKCLK